MAGSKITMTQEERACVLDFLGTDLGRKLLTASRGDLKKRSYEVLLARINDVRRSQSKLPWKEETLRTLWCRWICAYRRRINSVRDATTDVNAVVDCPDFDQLHALLNEQPAPNGDEAQQLAQQQMEAEEAAERERKRKRDFHNKSSQTPKRFGVEVVECVRKGLSLS